MIGCHKILLPPLHIKLGLMKQFVKALDQESKAFKYINLIFLSCLRERLKLVYLLDHRFERFSNALNSQKCSRRLKTQLCVVLLQWLKVSLEITGIKNMLGWFKLLSEIMANCNLLYFLKYKVIFLKYTKIFFNYMIFN